MHLLDELTNLNHNYTDYNEVRINKSIQSDLDKIIQQMFNSSDKGIKAIILTGAFGRGEGSVMIDRGIVKPLNDYDIYVISEGAHPGNTKKISLELADTIGIDYVDISYISRKKLKSLKPTIQNYDLKYGSQVIYGEKDIFSYIQPFNPEEIPLWEGVRLFFNRSAGVLGGLNERTIYSEDYPRGELYLTIQINKFILSWLDIILLTNHQYTSSYIQKLALLRNIHFDIGNNDEQLRIIDLIKKAVEFKLRPNLKVWGPSIRQDMFEVIELSRLVYERMMYAYLGVHRSIDNIPNAYIGSRRGNIQLMINNPLFLKKALEKGIFTPRLVLASLGMPLIDVISLPLSYLLFSIKEGSIDTKMFDIAKEYGEFIIRDTNRFDDKGGWEYLRQNLYSNWEIFCH